MKGGVEGGKAGKRQTDRQTWWFRVKLVPVTSLHFCGEEVAVFLQSQTCKCLLQHSGR